jgi:hypothetical protein
MDKLQKLEQEYTEAKEEYDRANFEFNKIVFALATEKATIDYVDILGTIMDKPVYRDIAEEMLRASDRFYNVRRNYNKEMKEECNEGGTKLGHIDVKMDKIFKKCIGKPYRPTVDEM